jgi:hypothetical protein
VYDQQVTHLPSAPPASPAPVLVSIADRQPQSRGTVLIRLILAIPHLVVLWALSIAAVVVAFIGWWGALFTGQLPAFAATFLTGVLQWQARVYGYVYLLTDVYPPFTLGDADYPVRTAVLPGKLNRLAVLFRFILVIPAFVVQWALSYGTLIISFFIWVITLITGSVPEPAHQALSASVRFQIRVYGYEYMLTSTYPWGLFGDRPDQVAGAPFAGSPFSGAQPAAPQFAGAELADSEPAGSEFGGAEPADADFGGAPFGGAPFASSEPAPATWSLILSGAGRGLVGLFLVIGAVALIVQGVLQISGTAGAVSKAAALSQAQTAFSPLNAAVGTANSSMQSCGQSVTCVTKVDGGLVTSFTTFATDIAAIRMPGGAPGTYAQDAAADSRTLAADFGRLSKATTASQYTSLASSLGIQAALDKLGTDYGKLATSLGGSATSS